MVLTGAGEVLIYVLDVCVCAGRLELYDWVFLCTVVDVLDGLWYIPDAGCDFQVLYVEG